MLTGSTKPRNSGSLSFGTSKRTTPCGLTPYNNQWSVQSPDPEGSKLSAETTLGFIRDNGVHESAHHERIETTGLSSPSRDVDGHVRQPLRETEGAFLCHTILK